MLTNKNDLYVVDSLFNDNCLTPSFVCIIFTKSSEEGSNFRYVQIIDDNGTVIGFESYLHSSFNESSPPLDIKKRAIKIGQEAIFSIQIGSNTFVSGTPEKIISELKNKNAIEGLVSKAPMVAFYLASMNDDERLRFQCLGKSIEIEKKSPNPDLESIMETYLEADLYTKIRRISFPSINVKFDAESNHIWASFAESLKLEEEKIIKPAIEEAIQSSLWNNLNLNISYFRKGRLNLFTNNNKNHNNRRINTTQAKFKINGYFITALKSHFNFNNQELGRFLAVSPSLIKSSEARKHRTLGVKLQNNIQMRLIRIGNLKDIWKRQDLVIQKNELALSLENQSTSSTRYTKRDLGAKFLRNLNVLNTKTTKNLDQIKQRLFEDYKCRFVGCITANRWNSLIFNEKIEWQFNEETLTKIVNTFAKSATQALLDADKSSSKNALIKLHANPAIFALSAFQGEYETFIIVSPTILNSKRELRKMIDNAELLMLY